MNIQHFTQGKGADSGGMYVDAETIIQGILIASLLATILTFGRMFAFIGIVTNAARKKGTEILKDRSIGDLASHAFRTLIEGLVALIVLVIVLFLAPIQGPGGALVGSIIIFLVVAYFVMANIFVHVLKRRNLPVFPNKREMKGV